MVKDEKRVNNDKYFETDEVFVRMKYSLSWHVGCLQLEGQFVLSRRGVVAPAT
jgi:hypothetical protein